MHALSKNDLSNGIAAMPQQVDAPSPSRTRRPLLGDRIGRAFARRWDRIAEEPLWFVRRMLTVVVIISSLSAGLAAINPAFAVFGASVVLLIVGVSVLISYAAKGSGYLDPRLGLLLALAGMGTLLVALVAALG
jgi:hypothetical protein